MGGNDTHQSSTGVTCLALIAMLTFYLASIGPVDALFSNGTIEHTALSRKIYKTLYKPMRWVRKDRHVDSIFIQYIRWWVNHLSTPGQPPYGSPG